MAIEDIIKKINADARRQADEMIAQAKQKRKDIVDAAKDKAQKDSAKIIEQAAQDAAKQKERVISSASMSAKLQILKEKRDILEKVFQKAAEALVCLADEDYRGLISRMVLKSVETGDEEILVPRDEKRIDKGLIEDINKQLKAKHKKGELKLVAVDAPNTGGFMIKGCKTLIDNSFPALVEQLKAPLEKQLAEALFK